MSNTMFSRLMRSIFVLLVSFLLVGPASSNPIDFEQYHSYENLTQALRDLAAEHPDLAGLVSIGTTLEGRTIWVLEIGAGGQSARDTRPAVLISAGFEGDYLWGSELALYIADYLLSQYDSNDEVKARLDAHTFYILPRVNPDGAEGMFADLQAGSSTNLKPYDDDNDARTDEDGPEDLNGDGFITFMRQLDPTGLYMIHSDVEGLMKKADPTKGESGTYKIFWEGLDNDNDSYINEDGPGGVDINRNFQHQYPYYQRSAGPHMVSERESRAVMDYVLVHRNIAVMLSFSEHDNLISVPNQRGELADPVPLNMISFAEESFADANKVGMFQNPRRLQFRYFMQEEEQATTRRSRPDRDPETTVNRSDLEYFSKIGAKYKEVTGITSKPAVYKPEGAFFEYGYFQYGVPSFSTPGWGIPSTGPDTTQSGPRPRSGSNDEEMLDVRLKIWMDAEEIDGFIAWTSFDHPTLGAVEIGGFKPYHTNNPPIAMLDSLGLKHAQFALYLSSQCPEVRVAKTEVTSHGADIFRIEAEIENRGLWPTSLAHGVTSRSVRPTMVQLEVPPESILSGNDKTSFFQALAGSGSRTTFQWIISGDTGDTVTLRVVSQKGGSDTADITLR